MYLYHFCVGGNGGGLELADYRQEIWQEIWLDVIMMSYTE
jgi:hypothetical protein